MQTVAPGLLLRTRIANKGFQPIKVSPGRRSRELSHLNAKKTKLNEREKGKR